MNEFYDTVMAVGGHHYNLGGGGGHDEFYQYINSPGASGGARRHGICVLVRDILMSPACESLLRLLVLLLGYTTARDYLLTGIAPVTSTFVLILIALHISQHDESGVNKTYYKKYSFHPNKIIQKREWYRVFTSAFVHKNALHLYMNSTSLSSLCIIEATCQMNPLQYTLNMLALIVGTGIFHACSCLDYDSGQEEWNMYTSGFTGVVFALKTVSNCLSPYSISNAPLTIPLLGNAWSYSIPFVMLPTFTHVFVELFVVETFLPGIFCVWNHASGILAGSVSGIIYTLLYLPASSSDLFHGNDYGSGDDIPLYIIVALVAVANDVLLHSELKIR